MNWQMLFNLEKCSVMHNGEKNSFPKKWGISADSLGALGANAHREKVQWVHHTQKN